MLPCWARPSVTDGRTGKLRILLSLNVRRRPGGEESALNTDGVRHRRRVSGGSSGSLHPTFSHFHIMRILSKMYRSLIFYRHSLSRPQAQRAAVWVLRSSEDHTAEDCTAKGSATARGAGTDSTWGQRGRALGSEPRQRLLSHPSLPGLQGP